MDGAHCWAPDTDENCYASVGSARVKWSLDVGDAHRDLSVVAVLVEDALAEEVAVVVLVGHKAFAGIVQLAVTMVDVGMAHNNHEMVHSCHYENNVHIGDGH